MKKFLACGIALLLALTACEQAQDSGAAGQEPVGDLTAVFGGIKSSVSGPMNRGDSRTFSVDADAAEREGGVIWTVEGANPKGDTAISKRGKLTVSAAETRSPLMVKAASAANPAAFDTLTVAVGNLPAEWEELTEGLRGLISNRTNGYKWFSVHADDTSFGIQALAYGDEVVTGAGKGRWVAGGGSDFREDRGDTGNGVHFWPVVAYSDDDGKTWTESTPEPVLYDEITRCIIYDGPENDKKFILSGSLGNLFWSYDGITWTKVQTALPNYNGHTDGINHMDQVVYGDIDRAGGARGRYLVLGTRGRFTWSDDGKTWIRQYADTDWRYVYTSTKPGAIPGCNSVLVRYGSGIIDGKPVKMFFGEGILDRKENEIHCYSRDGIDWSILDEDKVAAVRFVPAPPAGANKDVSWLDEADTGGLLFAKEDTPLYTAAGTTSRIVEAPEVQRHADFVAYGSGKFLAVGKGRRLARIDAGKARK
jgi:hypothetical protein